MDLQLQNSIQVKVADLLWNAQTDREVQNILEIFGHDAYVVYNMMIAASFDQVDDTSVAEIVLKKFME